MKKTNYFILSLFTLFLLGTIAPTMPNDKSYYEQLSGAINDIQESIFVSAGCLSSMFSQKLEYSLLQARDLGPESIARVQEILKKIKNKNGKQIYVRQMSPRLMNDIGRSNMLATHNTIYLDEDYFLSLPSDEQEFLIGHEVGHILGNHQALSLFSVLGMSVITGRIIHENETSNTLRGEMLKVFMLGMTSSFLTMLKKATEVQADLYAVHCLACYDGAIRHLSYDDDHMSWFERFLSAHPSNAERIAYIKENQAALYAKRARCRRMLLNK